MQCHWWLFDFETDYSLPKIATGKKSNEALARSPRVLHPGVLLRTNQVTSRNLDFFFSVSKVIKQVDLRPETFSVLVATVFR
jgi:hypothetical protein